MRRFLLMWVVLTFTVGCCKSQPHEVPGYEAKPVFAATSAAATTNGISGQSTNQSFSKAKKRLAGIYADHRVTLYCGCSFNADKSIDRTGCGYVAMRDNARSRRIEWEHVVPAHAFGQSFPEWRDGHPDCVNSKGKTFKGRNCARKMSAAFRYMEADMYNLHPAIGELNGRRSNYSMAEISGETRRFGRCDFEVADRKVEPPDAVRGDVARTYMYMEAAYPGRGVISRKNKKLFEAWSAQDPVDRWECERAKRIARQQGNVNGVVDGACRAANL